MALVNWHSVSAAVANCVVGSVVELLGGLGAGGHLRCSLLSLFHDQSHNHQGDQEQDGADDAHDQPNVGAGCVLIADRLTIVLKAGAGSVIHLYFCCFTTVSVIGSNALVTA